MSASNTSWTSIWSACAKIFWLSLLLANAPPTEAATYEGTIARILDQHCVACHRENEVGPFPLDTYSQARKHARQIALVTQSRFMPPWKPVPPSARFQHERRLSEIEIRALQTWVRQGMPRGVPGKRALPPKLSADPPDRRWQNPTSFTLPAEGEDPYRCFVVPTSEKEVQYINSFEFIPGNRKVVHHALFFFDVSGAARRLDSESEGPGYPCFGSPGFLPAASLGGWSPGNGRLRMPPETAVRLPAGADLVMQIHYHPTGRVEEDQSSLGVYFAPAKPARRLIDVALTSRTIDIPPGEKRYRVHDWFELPVDVTLWQIIPHAHWIATQVRAWYTTPDGERRTVLTIDDWDFNWQDIYQLKEPLQLEAGTLLEMEILYDNSEANARNPSQPPLRVLWGPGTKDEMAGVHWNVTVDDEQEDLADLTHSLWGKMMRSLQNK